LTQIGEQRKTGCVDSSAAWDQSTFCQLYGFFVCGNLRNLRAAMKVKKKKLALPRRTWKIKPVTRVKESAKRYYRVRAKSDLRKQADE